jgi:hypothetical protein
VFELSVAAFPSGLAAGQDGLWARDTTGMKVAPRGVKLSGTAVRATEVSFSPTLNFRYFENIKVE